MGDCVIAMRKSLTARFMMKKLGGVRSFLLLKHMRIEKLHIISMVVIMHNTFHHIKSGYQQKHLNPTRYHSLSLHCYLWAYNKIAYKLQQ